MIISRLKKAASIFRREEDGSVAIETVIMVPILFWTFLSSVGIFHAYRQHSISQKAGYTIGDMISRETNPIDQEYLTGARKLFQFLTLTELNDTTIRVSSIKYDATQDKYLKEWSKVSGPGKSEMTASQAEGLHGRLPIMKDDEFMMVVATWIDYDPVFDIGLNSHDVVNFIFTRPRYAPRVCWNQCN